MVRQLVYFHNIQFLVARSATTAGGLFVTMAIHTINLAEVTQGIADYVVRLGRALTSSELYEFIYDHIVEKYPNATMGEVQNLHRVVREAISQQSTGNEYERAKRRQWERGFGHHNPFSSGYGHRKYTTGTDWSNDQQDYSFKFQMDNEELYRRMTEDPKSKQPNYADYVAVPGLTGWSAPSAYNSYIGTGAFKWCRLIIKKGAPINVNRFEAIPFQFIPSSLIID